MRYHAKERKKKHPPVAFYDACIRPGFAKRRAAVYVLPEIKSARQVFGSYDVAKTQGPAPDP